MRVRIKIAAGALYDRNTVGRFDFAVQPGTVGTLLDQSYSKHPDLKDWRCVEVTDEHGRSAWVPLGPSMYEMLDDAPTGDKGTR